MTQQTLRIELLSRQHRHLLTDFHNQHNSLAIYPKRFALRHATRDLIGGTFVAITTDDQGNERLAGYFSLTTTSLEREVVVNIESLNKLPHFPVPGVLLTRLAVDQRLQGQGLGKYLLEEAVEYIGHVAK